MVLQFLAAFCGTLAFSVFFRVPKKYFILTGLVGGIAWMVYIFIGVRLGHTTTGIFAAAFSAVLLSRCFAVLMKCPMNMFLLPGIFPLVPGADIYYTAYYFVTKDYFRAAESFTRAFECAFAIAIAISVGILLPKSVFPGKRSNIQ